MRVVEVIADLRVSDIKSARAFYADFLGLSTEEFNLGWVARFTDPGTGAQLQVLTRDATAVQDPLISVKVDDVDAAYEEALARGYEVVHPITTEAWGVRRFFVQDPSGNVVNIVQHRA